MARPRMYQCPWCNNKFTSQEVVENVCPHCHKGVKAEQQTINKRILTEYVAVTTKQAPNPVLKPVAEAIDNDHGEIISARGSVPIVFLKLKQREYTLLYVGTGQIINWVYCPACSQKLFQNIVLGSAHLEQRHVCRKCKAKVNVIFTREKPDYLT